MQGLQKIIDKITSINVSIGKVVCWLIVALWVIICIEIFMRYIFRMPTIWVHETAGFLLCYTVMLGGAYTLAHGGHVNVDILYGRFTPRGRAILDLFTWLLFYAFIIVLVYKGWHLATLSITRLELSNTFWHPPIYFVKPIVFVGAVLIFFQGLTKTARDLYMAITGKELAVKAVTFGFEKGLEAE